MTPTQKRQMNLLDDIYEKIEQMILDNQFKTFEIKILSDVISKTIGCLQDLKTNAQLQSVCERWDKLHQNEFDRPLSTSLFRYKKPRGL